MNDNKNTSIESVLILQKMVFDKISFDRKGFKNDNDFSMNFNVQISETPDDTLYKVTLRLNGYKEDEYDLVIQITGYFTLDESGVKLKDTLLQKNAIAILMPYIRSEVSLITAQPEVDCLILPPFNINNMFVNT